MAGLDSFFAAFMLTLLNFVFVYKKAILTEQAWSIILHNHLLYNMYIVYLLVI